MVTAESSLSKIVRHAMLLSALLKKHKQNTGNKQTKRCRQAGRQTQKVQLLLINTVTGVCSEYTSNKAL